MHDADAGGHSISTSAAPRATFCAIEHAKIFGDDAIMSDGKSFLERREQAEITAAQIKEIAPDAKTISFIERQEIHHHHHGAPRGQALENLARDIAQGLEETFTIR
jgi:nucleotide-binding universal stress UspA family protein